MLLSMEREFDSIEGKQVESGVSTREKVLLALSAALMVCGCVGIFGYREFHHVSQEVVAVLFLIAPVMIWPSVVLMRRVDKSLFILALLLAIALSGLWVLKLLFAGPHGY